MIYFTFYIYFFSYFFFSLYILFAFDMKYVFIPTAIECGEVCSKIFAMIGGKLSFCNNDFCRIIHNTFAEGSVLAKVNCY